MTVTDDIELFIPAGEVLPKGSGTRFMKCDEFTFRDDGRSLEGMIVPYGQVVTVVEPDESGSLVKYREQFLNGSLAGMAQGFKARGVLDVPLLMGHGNHDSFQERIGFATGLDSRDEGAWATFRIYDDTNLPKVMSMLRESHTGFSIAFKDTRQPKLIDGVVSRVQVYVGHVAATPIPTYPGAGITAIRSQDDPQEAPKPSLAAVRAWLAQERQNTPQEVQP